jgi:galactokinase/mevalonate kinase-like predicted kinase
MSELDIFTRFLNAEEDIVATGACLSKYWDQKKVMAGGPGVCEPQHITALMEALRPLAHGMSICGAGGGGFLAIISKDPVSSKGTLKTLEAVVKRSLTNSLNDGVELAQTFPLVSAITVEDEGLSLTVGQELMH